MSAGDRVLLMELRERTSAAGNRYMSGWLGKASVVAFLDREADGPVWQVFVSTPTPRPGTDTTRSTTKRQPRRPAWVDQAGAGLVDPVDDL